MIAIRLAGPRRKNVKDSLILERAVDLDDREGLEASLREVGDAVEGCPLILDVALLPPLVSIRRLEFPPVNLTDIRRVLARDAARYFPAIQGPQVIGVARLGRPRAGPAPVLAAAAPTGVVEGLFEVAGVLGWRLGSIVPAAAAWYAAVEIVWPAIVRQGGHLVIVSEKGLQVLEMSGAGLSMVRRLPAGSGSDLLTSILAGATDQKVTENGREDEAILSLSAEEKDAPGEDQTESPINRVALAGPSVLCEPIAAMLEASGFEIVAPKGHENLVERPDLLAAAFARRARGPTLLPDAVRSQNRARSMQRARRLAVAGAALLLVAAGLEIWGLRRELGSAVARREALRARVAEAIAEGEALVPLVERVVALGELERSASRWSLVLADLTEHLPHDAYLESFAGRADTVLLQGVAGRAAGVFEQLEEADMIAGVAAEGPIERRQTGASPPTERFVLSAHVKEAP